MTQNGIQFYSHGKTSNVNNVTVDENTVFSIGSTIKVFTTILLADLVNKGLVKLNDPIEKYLPSYITIPQFKGHKIIIEDLATHTSGLPEVPAIIVHLSTLKKRGFKIHSNSEKI